MTKSARRGSGVLRMIGAVLIGVVMYVTLQAAPFYPPWLATLIAFAAVALGLSSPALASPLLVAAVALPLAAADLIVAASTLAVGLVVAWLLRDEGPGFLLVALIVIAVPLHAEWAIAPLAGYLLGRKSGAGVALAACLAIEAIGLLVGAPSLGATATGGTQPALIALSPAPEGALTLKWLPAAFSAADPARVLAVLTRAKDPILLVVQPLIWVVAAVLGSTFRPSSGVRALASVGAGVAGLALALGLLDGSLDGPVTAGAQASAAAVSLAVALVVTAASEWVFPVRHAKKAEAHGLRAEDAEVDELLRVIASAESQLAHRHSTHATVLITDLKSFSAMTEEIGSFEVAKVVQQHRDLLLPVIAQYKGRGKSTGGDGLLAAFSRESDAVRGAIAMQRTLEEFCNAQAHREKILMRVGIAQGEVVLDSGGRPFLGQGLNLAARVMNLGDGGHIMVTAAVANASKCSENERHSHGPFELKNIAQPVEVVEILWKKGMQAQEM